METVNYELVKGEIDYDIEDARHFSTPITRTQNKKNFPVNAENGKSV